MTKTLHRFGDLPWDIRVLIWKLAIHPARPGAHCFSISGNLKGHQTPDEITDAFTFPGTCRPSLIMSAPSWTTKSVDDDSFTGTEQVPASWFVNNTSTYISDSGFWTACKESRWVIQKHFRLQEWERIRKNNRNIPLTVPDFKKTPELVHFRDQNSRDYYSTVFPYQDLFIFQANDWDLDWRCIRADIMGSPDANYSGLQNIAVEFNQEWGIQHERCGADSVKVLSSLAYMAIDINVETSIETFWLIDYRIKGRPRVPTKEEAALPAPKVFYQDGRRFTQVSRRRDIPSCWDMDYAVGEHEWITCDDFLHSLEDRTDSLCDSYTMYHPNQCWCPSFAILACEAD